MNSEKPKTSPSKDEAVTYDHGKLRIPTSLIVAIVASLLTSIGSCSAAAMQHMQAGQTEKKADEALQVKLDIASMKNDIEWIKKKLSEDARPARDFR